MRLITILAVALLSTGITGQQAPLITTAGQPARLDIRVAGANSLRVTLKPVSFVGDFPATPAVADRKWPAPALTLQSLAARTERTVGRFRVVVEPSPLRVIGERCRRPCDPGAAFRNRRTADVRRRRRPGIGHGRRRTATRARNAVA